MRAAPPPPPQQGVHDEGGEGVGALRVLQITLGADTLAELDAIFPSPGPNGSKPAPEAYAC